ncbi:MAG: ABC transporter ATP-binding protein [Pseudomonadota bacterium]
MTDNNPEALVNVEGVRMHFAVGNSLAAAIRGKSTIVRAIDGVSVRLKQGESVGLLGESGCGKSTMGRLLLRILEPTDGRIIFRGTDVTHLKGQPLKAFRQEAQLIPQNPYEALNPRFSIGKSLHEPLENFRPRSTHEQLIDKVLKLVKLDGQRSLLDRYPHEVSGGQLQRIVMARALVLEPSFVVADEPVSMLDVSVRAGVLNVFRDVRKRLGLTAIYISHDLALVRYVCERTLVMYLGRIVEDGPTEEIVREPLHPYTKALVAAVPEPHPDQSRAPLPIKPGSPDARRQPTGCRFRDRCPDSFDQCIKSAPRPVVVGNRTVECHLFSAVSPEA